MINAFHWLGAFLFFAAMALLIVASVRNCLREQTGAETLTSFPPRPQVSSPIWHSGAFVPAFETSTAY